MSTKLSCPYCKKALKVGPEMAGKKARCPGCQKVFQVPAALAAPAAPPKPGAPAGNPRPGAPTTPVAPAKPGIPSAPVAPTKSGTPAAPVVPARSPAPGIPVKSTPQQTMRPVNPEAAAAKILSGPQKPPPAQPASAPAEPIKFRCDYCDDEVTVPADLAGKQAPCPSCRRIIKVPLPVKNEPKDWRKVDTRGPLGARRETEPAPEGAWGSSTTVAAVSQQSLLDAKVIPEYKEPLTPRQWVARILAGSLALSLLLSSGWAAWHFTVLSKQEQALRQALKYTEAGHEPPLGNEDAAEIHRAAGDFYVRAFRAEEAQKQFQIAQGRLTAADPGAIERDAILHDLAVSQVELGGTREEALEGRRLTWEAAQRDIQQTLRKIQAPHVRVRALRDVLRRIMAKSKEAPEQNLDQQFLVSMARGSSSSENDVAEVLALAGLELVRASREPEAKDLAKEALQVYEQTPADDPGGEDAKPPALPSTLIALMVALGQKEEVAKKFLPAPATDKEVSRLDGRLGYSQGWARAGKWKEALALANAPGAPGQRLQALIALADIALDTQPPAEEEADRFLKAAGAAAVELQGQAVSPWLWLELVRLRVRAGKTEKIQELMRALPAEIQGRAQLEVLRDTLSHGKKADEEALKTEADRKEHAYRLALELLARNNAEHGSSSAVQKAIGSWEPESLRPFGYVGLALGMQGGGP